MKSFTGWLGWLLMLVVVGAGLLFYNLVHVPQRDRMLKQQQEIRMWTGEIQTLSARVKQLEAQPEVPYFTVFTFDELFSGPESFAVSRLGENVLQQCVAKLREVKGTIEVTGHTDNKPVPEALKGRFDSNWELGAAKASAVVKALVAWGIAPERFVVRSCGSTRPRDDNATPEGRQRNGRIEIVVRT